MYKIDINSIISINASSLIIMGSNYQLSIKVAGKLKVLHVRMMQ